MRKTPGVWTKIMAGAMALLFAPDCTAPLDDTAPDNDSGGSSSGSVEEDEPAGVLLAASRWTLAWDEEGVVPTPGGGFELETDLGYRVRVTSGRILSHSVSFGPCEGAVADATSGGAFWSLPIRSAHAHEGGDPSTIETSLVEDLLDLHESDSDSSFAPVRYCRAHWLLARATEKTSGPDDVDMSNRSIVVSGTFERDGESHDFTVDTWWPQGQLVDLDAAVAPDVLETAQSEGGAHHAFVTVTRHLGRLFDGIDFEVASPDELAGLTVDNLVSSSEIRIELWSAGSSR